MTISFIKKKTFLEALVTDFLSDLYYGNSLRSFIAVLLKNYKSPVYLDAFRVEEEHSTCISYRKLLRHCHQLFRDLAVSDLI